MFIRNVPLAVVLQQHIGCTAAGNTEGTFIVGTTQDCAGIGDDCPASVLGNLRGRAAGVYLHHSTTVDCGLDYAAAIKNILPPTILQGGLTCSPSCVDSLGTTINGSVICTPVDALVPTVVNGDTCGAPTTGDSLRPEIVNGGTCDAPTTEDYLRPFIVNGGTCGAPTAVDILHPAPVNGGTCGTTGDTLVPTGNGGTCGAPTTGDILLPAIVNGGTCGTIRLISTS